MFKKLITILLLITLLAPTALAQTRTRKLVRGTVNLITGWVEIPKNIYEKTVEDNIATGLTSGTIGGVGMAIVRTGAGLYEMTTFPWPVPENYQVILEPEFVFGNGGEKRVKEESNDSQRSDITAEGGAWEGTRVEGLTVGSVGVERD